MLLLLVPLAFAGYGDAVDGLPSLSERQLVLWTNAARIAPEAFSSEYLNAGCSFENDFTDIERTAQDPLRWNSDLNEAARFHSTDMFDNNWFDHASSDGTPFGTRISRFYDGASGENIANGYGSAYSAVFDGWMCSAGHRKNIMRPEYSELGTGIVGSYYTQNFGGQAIEIHAVGSGAHWFESERVVFRADVFDGAGGIPDAVNVIWNGVPANMTLETGVANRGIYRTTRNLTQAAETEEPGCFEYYFEATYGETTSRFPETGSYGWGTCTFADADAQWLPRQLEPELDEGGGCSTVQGAPVSLVGGLLGLMALGRRRRLRARR